MPQRTENRGRTHPRTFEGGTAVGEKGGGGGRGKWREREANTRTREHTYITPAGIRTKTILHRSFQPRVHFSEDFSSEDCFRRIILKDRSFFPFIAQCLRGFRCAVLKDNKAVDRYE